MSNLNPDQVKALNVIKKWWPGNELYIVLDAVAGTGKTYLVNEILNQLPNCSPMILCPTHEALKQVRDKVKGNYPFRTVHSALGIAPTDTKDDLEFKQIALPNFWDNINLVILDEASMIPNWILKILVSTQTKILFLGHSSQLPPVDLRRGIMDKCLSPVFKQGWQTITLTIPMRNTGTLFDFNNHLERMIYTSDRVIPNTFDVTLAELNEYIDSTQGKLDILNGDTKIVLWSNQGVDSWNVKLRLKLFGPTSLSQRYLASDKVILTAPLCVIPGLENHSDIGLREIDYNSPELDKCYSNTKGEVLYAEEVEVRLNSKLHIPCYKILVKCDDATRYFYECIDSSDYHRIDDYYKHIAWNAKDKKSKIKAFKVRRFILSCFAQVKHYYACTTHRVQGVTIPNVIVINSDISKIKNIIEAKKCRYVACSRTKDNLMFYRGVI